MPAPSRSRASNLAPRPNPVTPKSLLRLEKRGAKKVPSTGTGRPANGGALASLSGDPFYLPTATMDLDANR